MEPMQCLQNMYMYAKHVYVKHVYAKRVICITHAITLWEDLLLNLIAVVTEQLEAKNII